MKRILLVITATVIFLSCGRFGNKEADGKKDQRVVCLSKHLTEMVFALGKGHDLVAVDLSSTYPDSAKLLKTVGYHRALSAESIINLALAYASRILFMKAGTIAYDIHPEELTSSIIKEVFDVNASVIRPPGTARPVVIYQ